MNLHRLIITLTALAFFTTASAGCGKKEGKGDAKKGGTASSAKWSKKDFPRLAKIEIPGFKKLPNSAKPFMNVTNYYEGTKNAKGFYPFVWAIFNPCLGCARKKMGDLAAWKKMLPNLNMRLPKAVKEDPKLVNELKEMDFEGTKVMTVYTKSFVKNGPSKVSAHGLDVYFNNGTNELILMVFARSRPHKSIKSLKELEESLTKDEMIAAAKAAFKHLKKEL